VHREKALPADASAKETAMTSVDVRTRSDADLRAVDFVAFHEEELPALLARGHGEVAGRGLAALGLPPLGLEVGARTYTYRAGEGGVEVVPGGDGAAAVAALDPEAFSDLVQDVRSTVALVIGRSVRMVRGGERPLIEWEPVLRAMIDGRRVHERGAVTVSDRGGEPLDLARAFTLEDSRDEMAHFLAEAGFLRLTGVFTPAEMARVNADIDRAVPRYRPDDGRSWWARTRAGEHRPVRLQRFQEESDAVARLLEDERLRAVAGLTGDGHRPRRTDNAIEVLVKPIGVVEGISDVSWHKDCSLGRHSYQCCGMTLGIAVTAAGVESGQLCVVAGSHRALVQAKGLREDLDLPRVGLPVGPGDVTVHLSCTLHMSIPPTRAERRVLYAGCPLPPRPGDRPEQAEKIRDIRERAPAAVGDKGSIGDDPALRQMNAYDVRGLR
jgi:hypothetical protein